MRGPWGALAVAAVLVPTLAVQSCRLRTAQRDAAAAALRADSTAAAADTARQLNAAARRLLGDSLVGVERRVVQQRQRADALDRALQRERIARAGLEVAVRRLDSTVVALGATRPDPGDTTVRVAAWQFRQTPYTVEAEARVPPPPRIGTLALTVGLDPIPLELRLGCGAAGPDGIRPATATLVGPPWAQPTLQRIEQAPELCRSPALAPRGPSRWRWFGIGAGSILVARWACRVMGWCA